MKLSSCVLRVLLSVVLALAILFFLTTVGLGTYAIVNAGQVAACIDNDPTTLCGISTNATQFNYWMAGASGAAVIHSLLATLMLCVAVELLKRKQLARKPSTLPKDFKELKALVEKEKSEEEGKATTMGGATTVGGTTVGGGNTVQLKVIDSDGVAVEGVDGVDGIIHPRHVRVSIDVVGGEEVKEWQETTVRSFTPLAGVVLFFGILAAMCALLSMLWGIAISYDEFNPRLLSVTDSSTITATNYIVVDILIGIITPILLFISTGLIAIVVDYVTVGQMDMRKGIGYILSSVAMQEGKENYYWTVLDTFYFPMNKRPHRRDHGLLYSCDRSRYTWYFTIVCALSLLLVFSYFVDLTVTEEFTSSKCPSDVSYVCFSQHNYAYLNCSGSLNMTGAIVCYKFLRFGIDVNLITALSQSFAFYLLITTFFTQVFTVVKGLVSIKPSRFWGVGLILFAGLLIGGAIAVLVSSDVLVAYTGILSILEFFMVGAAVFVIGLLVVEGKWWEKLPSYGARQVHFVQYSDTSRRKLEEIHHATALEEEEGKEIEHEPIAPVRH